MWVHLHWVPFDEARLQPLLRTSRPELWRVAAPRRPDARRARRASAATASPRQARRRARRAAREGRLAGDGARAARADAARARPGPPLAAPHLPLAAPGGRARTRRPSSSACTTPRPSSACAGWTSARCGSGARTGARARRCSAASSTSCARRRARASRAATRRRARRRSSCSASCARSRAGSARITTTARRRPSAASCATRSGRRSRARRCPATGASCCSTPSSRRRRWPSATARSCSRDATCEPARSSTRATRRPPRSPDRPCSSYGPSLSSRRAADRLRDLRGQPHVRQALRQRRRRGRRHGRRHRARRRGRLRRRARRDRLRPGAVGRRQRRRLPERRRRPDVAELALGDPRARARPARRGARDDRPARRRLRRGDLRRRPGRRVHVVLARAPAGLRLRPRDAHGHARQPHRRAAPSAPPRRGSRRCRATAGGSRSRRRAWPAGARASTSATCASARRAAISGPHRGFAHEPSISADGRRVAFAELPRGGGQSPSGRPAQRAARARPRRRRRSPSSARGAARAGRASRTSPATATRVAYTTDAGVAAGGGPGGLHVVVADLARPARSRRSSPRGADGLVRHDTRAAAAGRTPLQPRPAGVVRRSGEAAGARAAARCAARRARAVRGGRRRRGRAPSRSAGPRRPPSSRSPSSARGPTAPIPTTSGCARAGSTGRRRWRRSRLPHVANPAPLTGAAGERSYRGSVGWWRTTLAVGAPGRYVVRFGSVHYRATVWIDGARRLRARRRVRAVRVPGDAHPRRARGRPARELAAARAPAAPGL